MVSLVEDVLGDDIYLGDSFQLVDLHPEILPALEADQVFGL